MELIPLAIAWMLGVLTADLVGARTGWAWPLAAVGIVFLVAAVPLRRRAVIATALACCACALLGAARLCAVQPVPGPQHIVHAADQGEIVVDGWVDGDPKRTEDGQQITLIVEATQTARGARSADGLLLANLAPYPLVEYGQRLRLTGALRAPRGPEHPGDFDYRTYLRRKGILVTMNDPRVRALAGDRGIAPLRALLALRAQSRAVLLQSLPEPQASIAVGVLLGLQSSIPDDVYATFSATGTSHILVVSGWNETVIQSKVQAPAPPLRHSMTGLGQRAASAAGLRCQDGTPPRPPDCPLRQVGVPPSA